VFWCSLCRTRDHRPFCDPSARNVLPRDRRLGRAPCSWAPLGRLTRRWPASISVGMNAGMRISASISPSQTDGQFVELAVEVFTMQPIASFMGALWGLLDLGHKPTHPNANFTRRFVRREESNPQPR
jgi:hypothetical protein